MLVACFVVLYLVCIYINIHVYLCIYVFMHKIYVYIVSKILCIMYFLCIELRSFGLRRGFRVFWGQVDLSTCDEFFRSAHHFFVAFIYAYKLLCLRMKKET